MKCITFTFAQQPGDSHIRNIHTVRWGILCFWLLCFQVPAIPQVYAVSDSAISLINKGSLREAVGLLKARLTELDNDAALLRLLGKAYYRLQRYDSAVIAYQAAAASAACDTCSRDIEIAGTIALEANDLPAARKCLHAALDRGSRTAGVRMASACYLEGESYVQKLDYASATAFYREGLAYAQDTLLYERLLFCLYKSDKDEEVLSLCDSLIRKYPGFSVPHTFTGLVSLTRGDRALGRGRYREAAASYGKALEEVPLSAPASYGLGICCEKLSDTEQAITHYERAVELGMMEPGVYRDLGRLYSSVGRLEDAQEMLRMGLRLDINAGRLWELLGGVYERMEDQHRSGICRKMAGFYGIITPGVSTESANDREIREVLGDSTFKGRRSIRDWMIVRDLADTTADPADSLVLDKQPVLKTNVQPDYPEAWRLAGMEGTVWVTVLIDTLGRVKKCHVLRSDAVMLSQPSLEAAMQWEFRPAEVKGRPVAVWAAIPFRFKLNR